MSINAYNFSENDIHEHDDPFFGYRIVDPESEDPYTPSDLAKMKERIYGSCCPRFPLQYLINLIQYAGGECFWHETINAEDLDVYFSIEMLEEMQKIGFRYMAGIKASENSQEAAKFTNNFLQYQSRVYLKIKTERELDYIYFDYIEAHTEADEPCLGTSIIFSTIPVVSTGYEQLLQPICSRLITLKRIEEEAEYQRQQEQQEKMEKQNLQIQGMKKFFHSQGLPPEQIDQILNPKGIPNHQVSR